MISDILLFSSLLLVALGYFTYATVGRHLNIVGYTLFGIYWLTQIPHFLMAPESDMFNAIACALALPFFVYIACQEWLSIKRKESLECLRFFAGMTFFAGFFYFLIEKTEALSYAFRYATATQTVWLLKTMGINAQQEGIWIDWRDASAGIILACTGMQSIMVFIAIVIVVKAELKRRLYTFLVTVPVIWILNLVRNAGLVYIVGTTNISMTDAHNTIGKGGSLLALLIIVFCVFKLLPELLDRMVELIELRKRVKLRNVNLAKS